MVHNIYTAFPMVSNFGILSQLKRTLCIYKYASLLVERRNFFFISISFFKKGFTNATLRVAF